MAELLLQGLRWVWVGLQGCTHYGTSPLLEENEQGTGAKQGLRKGQLQPGCVHPTGPSYTGKVGWLAGSPLAGMIGSVGVPLLSLLELG